MRHTTKAAAQRLAGAEAAKGRPVMPGRTRLIRASLIAAVLAVAGCGATPTERWMTSAGAFEYGVRGALAAHSAGVIDDEVMRDLDPVVEGANFALDAGYDRLPEGGTIFDESMDIVDAAILALATAGAEDDR